MKLPSVSIQFVLGKLNPKKKPNITPSRARLTQIYSKASNRPKNEAGVFLLQGDNGAIHLGTNYNHLAPPFEALGGGIPHSGSGGRPHIEGGEGGGEMLGDTEKQLPSPAIRDAVPMEVSLGGRSQTVHRPARGVYANTAARVEEAEGTPTGPRRSPQRHAATTPRQGCTGEPGGTPQPPFVMANGHSDGWARFLCDKKMRKKICGKNM